MTRTIRDIDNKMVVTELRKRRDEFVIQIGENNIRFKEFCVLVSHYFQGGFFGWNEQIPDYVLNTINDIKHITKEDDIELKKCDNLPKVC